MPANLHGCVLFSTFFFQVALLHINRIDHIRYPHRTCFFNNKQMDARASPTRSRARALDEADPLARFRAEFVIPSKAQISSAATLLPPDRGALNFVVVVRRFLALDSGLLADSTVLYLVYVCV
jgi:hypothetical protein